MLYNSSDHSLFLYIIHVSPCGIIFVFCWRSLEIFTRTSFLKITHRVHKNGEAHERLYQNHQKQNLLRSPEDWRPD